MEDPAHGAVVAAQTPVHTTKLLHTSLGGTYQSDPRNSKRLAHDTRMWHQYFALNVVNGEINLRLDHDVRSHIKPEDVPQRARALSPQKVPSPCPRTDIRFPTKVLTVKHKRDCAIQKHRTKSTTFRGICIASLVIHGRPTWNPAIHLDIHNSSSSSLARIRDSRSIFNLG